MLEVSRQSWIDAHIRPLDGAGWAARILGGETRETSAARQTHASGGTGLGLHGQRCHSGHCVANGSHSAVTHWLGKRITGEQRADFELRQGVPDTRHASSPGEKLPCPRQCLHGRVLHSPLTAPCGEPADAVPPDTPRPPRRGLLRRSSQRLPIAHHRLQLLVRLPQHLVPRQFPVLLRTPAPHARQQHDPTANARSHRLAPLPRPAVAP